MSALKLGFIGVGFVAGFHARALTQVRDVEIAGVTSLSVPNARVFSNRVQKMGIGDATVYPSITELAKNVDVVAIYAPNSVRLEAIEELVDAVKGGAVLKGVICEKPLGRNLMEARRLVEMADGVGLKTAYFENQIFMKAIREQLRQLEPQQKTMGPLVLVRSAEEHAGPHMPWFWDPTVQGGGVLCDMGCHSIAVGWYALTPLDKPPMFLKPVSMMAECGLLKWGLPSWRQKLLDRTGIDYNKTPAEDFTTGIVTFKNPETGDFVKCQFTDSWMYEKQGLRLYMDGMGPGYAFEVNSLTSPAQIFIGDEAAEAVANAETALEKATATRGLMSVQYNEPDLYGYTDENREATISFQNGKDAYLSWRYGMEVTRLVMAAYMSDEKRKTIDLTDPAVQKELETFVPLIQQGKGVEVLF